MTIPFPLQRLRWWQPAAADSPDAPAASAAPATYWLTRFVLLRLLGFIYLIAFLVAANQLVPLIGHNGLLPADAFLNQVGRYFGSRAEGFLQVPSLFWWNLSDTALI